MASSRSVIVIGGGLSGLSAASLLHKQGIDVTVLEASARFGGRLYSIQDEKMEDFDLGGSYIGPTQDRVYRVAKELGIATRDVCRDDDEDVVCYRGGKSIRFQGILPPVGSVSDMLDSNYLLRQIHELCDQIPLDAPWLTPDAEALDKISFQEWLAKVVDSETARDNARMNLRLNMTAEPYEVSLLWTLWYIKSAGGMNRMNAFKGGAQEKVFVGGAQQLPIKLAESLPPGKAITEMPVVKISQDDESVTVYGADGSVYKADYAVLAILPAAQLRIQFEPELPLLRSQFIRHVPLGSVIKTLTFYDKPYWRLNGCCGICYVEDEGDEFPIVSTVDHCQPEKGSYCLVGFIAGDKAYLYAEMTREERMEKVARQYAQIFDCEELATPVGYEEKNWCEDPWAGGCYTGIMPPGVLTTFGSVVRAPIGRVYLAGTETATMWSGYMDGAVQAGERAAREIMHEMGLCSKDEIFQEEPPNKDFVAPDFPPTLLQRYSPSANQVTRFITTSCVMAAGALAASRLLFSKL